MHAGRRALSAHASSHWLPPRHGCLHGRAPLTDMTLCTTAPTAGTAADQPMRGTWAGVAAASQPRWGVAMQTMWQGRRPATVPAPGSYRRPTA